MSRDVHICTHWLRHRIPPILLHLDSYTRALLVSKDRQHLIGTSWWIRSDTENNLQQVDMITFFILSFSGQQMAQQMVQTNPELVEQLRRQMGGGFPPGGPPPPPSDL
jgi:hypothetical protein